MIEARGDYVPDRDGNTIFRFLYSYHVPNENKFVTDVYDIYSITYVSIDETRNNGTYKDTSNREDCKLSLAPGVSSSYCGISENSSETNSVDNSTVNTEVENNANVAETVASTIAPNTEVSEATTTEDAKPTAEVVAETSEQPTAVSAPEVVVPESTPSETATVSEVKPTEPETAERLAVKSLKEAIANYQELSFVTTRVGDVTRYLIQREGIDIALIDPNSKQILVNNTGLVNYNLTQDQNGNIHITKSPNQPAIKEANELTSLHTDLNHVEMNNLNKRMGELRGIDASAGVWARALGGKGSSDSYKYKFTHIQTGFDKQSHLSNAELFAGVTVTHTSIDIEGKASSTNGDVKSIGAGVYATTLFNNGFYLDTIAKYVKNNQANLADNGHKLTIKASDGLVGRLGVNAGKTFEIGQSKVTAWAGIGYQWDIAKRNEILVDGISARNSKKDARMLMDLGVNIRANDKLNIGLSLEGSAFGKYNTDLSVNSNIRYSY